MLEKIKSSFLCSRITFKFLCRIRSNHSFGSKWPSPSAASPLEENSITQPNSYGKNPTVFTSLLCEHPIFNFNPSVIYLQEKDQNQKQYS